MLGGNVFKCVALGSLIVFGVLICVTPTVIIFSIWSSYWYELWHEANDMNTAIAKVDDIRPYDRCDNYGHIEFSTGWTTALSMNVGANVALAVCPLVMVLGVAYPPFTLLGCIGQTLGTFFQVAALSVTALFLYNYEGQYCKDVTAPVKVTADGFITFADHYERILDLFIAHCASIVFYNCCAICALQASLAGSLAIYGR